MRMKCLLFQSKVAEYKAIEATKKEKSCHNALSQQGQQQQPAFMCVTYVMFLQHRQTQLLHIVLGIVCSHRVTTKLEEECAREMKQLCWLYSEAEERKKV